MTMTENPYTTAVNKARGKRRQKEDKCRFEKQPPNLQDKGWQRQNGNQAKDNAVLLVDKWRAEKDITTRRGGHNQNLGDKKRGPAETATNVKGHPPKLDTWKRKREGRGRRQPPKIGDKWKETKNGRGPGRIRTEAGRQIKGDKEPGRRTRHDLGTRFPFRKTNRYRIYAATLASFSNWNDLTDSNRACLPSPLNMFG